MRPFEHIPQNAIVLSVAFRRIADFVTANPHISLKVEDAWTEMARETLKEELHQGLLQKDWETFYFREKELNIFFRKQLDDGKLTAYVRHPTSGEILQMPSWDWLQSILRSGQIPTGIYNDTFALEPGPSSEIDGRFRTIFFLKAEFDDWFIRTFDQPEKVTADIKKPVRHSHHSHRRRAILDIARQLWPNGLPAGLGVGSRNELILATLSEKQLDPVSDITIQRALAGFPRTSN